MCVEVGDAARRKVDPVAPDHRRLGRSVGQLPDERVPVDPRRSEMRFVTLDVVHDTVAVFGGDSLGVLGQAKDQWNV
jgi:hypothetical protein